MELPPAKRPRTDGVPGPEQKAALVQRLLAAKEASGKSFDECLARHNLCSCSKHRRALGLVLDPRIATGLGLTNAYTAAWPN